MNIELRKFIEMTLIDIITAIDNTNAVSKPSNVLTGKTFALDMSDGGIEFNVQVVASEKKGEEGGSGINISVLGIGGDVGGKLHNENTTERTNLIKFKVTTAYVG